MTPRQLTLLGFLVDLGADLGHRLLDLDARPGNVREQRAREWAVGAGFAIKSGLSGTGGKRDQRTFAGFHFGETNLHVDAAGGFGGTNFRGERIVAAGIEEHQLDLGIAHGLIERDVDVDGAPNLTSISDLRSASTGTRKLVPFTAMPWPA